MPKKYTYTLPIDDCGLSYLLFILSQIDEPETSECQRLTELLDLFREVVWNFVHLVTGKITEIEDKSTPDNCQTQNCIVIETSNSTTASILSAINMLYEERSKCLIYGNIAKVYQINCILDEIRELTVEILVSEIAKEIKKISQNN